MTFTVQYRKRSTAGKPSRRASNAGFTLVEILLALGLSVALMTAVFSALDLYRQFTTVGRDEMEKSQIARALFRKVETDIRSSMFQNKKENVTSFTTGSTSGNSSASTSSSNSSSGNQSDDETEIADPADAFSGGSTGIFGDAETLVIHVSRPPRSSLLIIESADDVSPLPESDLKSIAYFLATPGADGLRGLTADAGSGESGGKAVGGFARLEGDRLKMTLADEAADLETLAGQTQILASEVNFLGFRYLTQGLDGPEWMESWDSAFQGSLPLAIEITLGFHSPDKQEKPNGTDNQSSKKYRLVVSLPLAETTAPADF